MDCSDTTQSLQVSLEGRFKKSFLGLNVGDQEVEELFLVSPQNTSSQSASNSACVPKAAQKEGAVRVWYAILLLGAPEFFLLERGW